MAMITNNGVDFYPYRACVQYCNITSKINTKSYKQKNNSLNVLSRLSLLNLHVHVPKMLQTHKKTKWAKCLKHKVSQFNIPWQIF